MSDFSDTWLALREPADRRARADELLQGPAPGSDGTLEVLDLGCGTGANLRHLFPRLAALGYTEQHWTCVDRDPRLLRRLRARTHAWAAGAGYGVLDGVGELTVTEGERHCVARVLQTDLGAAFATPGPDALPLSSTASTTPPELDPMLPTDGLVTASALLDLVSEPWLKQLLISCRAARCRLLFALSYDGRCTLCPSHEDDRLVIDLVNLHQQTDKGLGAALGPSAAGAAAAECARLGYRVRHARSDWHLATDEALLQRALLDGWLEAATEMAPALGERLRRWRSRRRQWLEAGDSEMSVGHVDLWAEPMPRTSQGRETP